MEEVNKQMRRLFIVRKDLNLSPGKMSAQLMHCAEAYWTRMMKRSIFGIYKENKDEIGFSSCDENGNDSVSGYHLEMLIDADTMENYICGTFTKTVCAAKNKNHLMNAVEKAKELGLVENEDFGLIYDKCLTELTPEEEDGTTLTCIWFKPLLDEKAHYISKKYQLYK